MSILRLIVAIIIFLLAATNGAKAASPAASENSQPAKAVFNIASVAGACGSADGSTVTMVPTADLCSAGTATVVSGNDPWVWSCTGISGGITAGCAALLPRSGVLVPQPGKTRPTWADVNYLMSIATGKTIPSAADLLQGDIAPLDYQGKPIGNGKIDSNDIIGITQMVFGLR